MYHIINALKSFIRLVLYLASVIIPIKDIKHLIQPIKCLKLNIWNLDIP
nr:MAG TPA: hypothetical protein [Caudoviricetes sp.]